MSFLHLEIEFVLWYVCLPSSRYYRFVYCRWTVSCFVVVDVDDSINTISSDSPRALNFKQNWHSTWTQSDQFWFRWFRVSYKQQTRLARVFEALRCTGKKCSVSCTTTGCNFFSCIREKKMVSCNLFKFSRQYNKRSQYWDVQQLLSIFDETRKSTLHWSKIWLFAEVFILPSISSSSTW